MDIWLDWLVLALVIAIWAGYARFAKVKAKTTHCVASALHDQRQEWIYRMLLRENRIADVSILTGVEQSVIFFASSALLIIGALLTVIVGDASGVHHLESAELSYWLSAPQELQLIVVLLVFIRAFFHLTWSVRQYSFFAVLIGSAPTVEEARQMSVEERQAIANQIAYVADRAGHSFNFGLRAWYFALSFIAWVISAWLMLLAAVIVAGVLYRREFRSKSMLAMVASLKSLEAIRK